MKSGSFEKSCQPVATAFTHPLPGMVTSSKLKLFTLLSHFLIVTGMFHGVLTMGLAEVLLFTSNPARPTPGSLNSWPLFLGNLCSLTGQVAILLSIRIRQEPLRKKMHLSGLGLLCLSVLVFYARTIGNPDVYIIPVTVVPFAYCVVWTFLRTRITKTLVHIKNYIKL